MEQNNQDPATGSVARHRSRRTRMSQHHVTCQKPNKPAPRPYGKSPSIALAGFSLRLPSFSAILVRFSTLLKVFLTRAASKSTQSHYADADWDPAFPNRYRLPDCTVAFTTPRSDHGNASSKVAHRRCHFLRSTVWRKCRRLVSEKLTNQRIEQIQDAWSARLLHIQVEDSNGRYGWL